MLFSEYADSAAKTMNKGAAKRERSAHFALGVADELLELYQGMRWYGYAGTVAARDNVIEELGDLMWYLTNYSRWNSLAVAKVFEAPLEHICFNPPGCDSSDIVFARLLASCITCISTTKKELYHEHSRSEQTIKSLTAAVMDAMSDICVMAVLFGSNIHEVCVRNLAKLGARYGESFSSERSVSRDYAAEQDAANVAADEARARAT